MVCSLPGDLAGGAQNHSTGSGRADLSNPQSHHQRERGGGEGDHPFSLLASQTG